MEISPLPIQDRDISDSDSSCACDDLNHYVVRITPYAKFTFDDLQQRLDEEPHIFRYIISEEQKPRLHYHLVLTVDETFDIQQVRDVIKAFLTPFWHNPDTHRLPKGFGNKQYNCEATQTIDEAISYALKEGGRYHQVGWDKDYIDTRIKASFKKCDTKTFNSELHELQKQFQENEGMNMTTYMVDFIKLKSRYNQMINMQHAYQYALSQQIQRNPEEAESFVINFLYKQ